MCFNPFCWFQPEDGETVVKKRKVSLKIVFACHSFELFSLSQLCIKITMNFMLSWYLFLVRFVRYYAQPKLEIIKTA